VNRIRNAVHGILPPIVLDSIARNGDARQRRWALDTLARDQSLRAARIQNLILRYPRRGDVVARELAGRPLRTIRDAQGQENLSGPIVRSEGGGPTGDPAVDEAYDGLGDTYRFYWEVFQRDSIDDEGMPLEAVVHFGQLYDNAFWDGQRMIFGDGDGELFNRFTIALDVIGHELTHGVIENETGLEYWGQSGALNEHLADVGGVMVKQYALGQTSEEADWLIGAGLFTPAVSGVALRSMKAPGTAYDDPVLGTDPQPDHMDRYVTTLSDNGGVHINSGIPNLAFYRAALALGGRSWDRAGRIWYAALQDSRVIQTTRFLAFAEATLRAARRMFGQGPEEEVRGAWESVGISA
jgi:Zn-dependent metalloprotease